MSEQKYASWNPWHGCTKYSEGCRYCYVYRQDEAYGSSVSPEQCRKTQNFDLPIKKDSEGWSALITVPLSLMGGDKGKKELPFYFIRYFSDPAAKKKATLRFAVDVPVEEPLVYPRLKLMLPEKK